jgi:serine/threonine protein kinase
MGTVYLAHDTQLDRLVALKVPRLPADGVEEFLQRFYREGRAAAALRHPDICAVYDVGQIEGVHHIAMAYLEGPDALAEGRTQSGAGNGAAMA